MNEQHNDFHKTSSEAMESLRKAKLRNSCFTLAFVIAVIGWFAVSQWQKENDMDYVGGNVFYLARSSAASTGNVWYSESFGCQLIYSGVFTTDSTFTEINPDLAEKYDVSDDGLVYTIYMKDGLQWSDGKPLTAEDVAWSIESVLLHASINSVFSAAFNKIVGVEEWKEVGVESWENGGTHSLEGVSVVGNTVVITLETPYANFPKALTQFCPLPKHVFEEMNPSEIMSSDEYTLNYVTSGMYKLDVVNSDGDAELIHNPNYYGEHSDIERVILLGDYQNSHLSYYPTTDLREMVTYNSINGYKEYKVDVQFYRYFVFNLMAGYEQRELVPELDEDGNEVKDSDGNVVLVEDTSVIEYPDDREENYPVQNVLFREAISLAMNRVALMDEVYQKTGSVTFSEAGNEAYTEFLLDYNPNLARQKLEESGYDLNRPFTIGYYHTDINTALFLEEVKSYLEDIGLTVIVKRTSGGVALYQTREYDMYLKAYPAYSSLDWYNEYLYSNDTLRPVLGTDLFDDLLIELEMTTTQEDYDVVMSKLQDLDSSLLYKIPMISLGESAFINGNRVSLPPLLKSEEGN